MARLNSPIVYDFKPHHFATYPIWVWDDEMNGNVPLEIDDEWRLWGDLFIKALFSSNDIQIQGYLIGYPENYFAIGLFINGKEYVINRNTIQGNGKNLADIKNALGLTDESLFPIEYESDVLIPGTSRLQGRLEW